MTHKQYRYLENLIDRGLVFRTWNPVLGSKKIQKAYIVGSMYPIALNRDSRSYTKLKEIKNNGPLF